VGDSRNREGQLKPLIRRAALFLDRDGVLNEPIWDDRARAAESPLMVEDVVLTDGAANAVTRARRAGLPVIVVSNQPAAAKGIVDVPVIYAVHAQVVALLAAQGAVIERSYLCLHHPDGSVTGLNQTCTCRKPAPGMLLSAAEDLDLDLSRCWLIGDTDADVGAARRAQLAGVVVVANPLSAHRRGAMCAMADAATETLPAALDIVLARMTGHGSLLGS
jgi:D-glycero-D-manno-heptose 1,7-bisphosphate phosphatase